MLDLCRGRCEREREVLEYGTKLALFKGTHKFHEIRVTWWLISESMSKTHRSIYPSISIHLSIYIKIHIPRSCPLSLISNIIMRGIDVLIELLPSLAVACAWYSERFRHFLYTQISTQRENSVVSESCTAYTQNNCERVMYAVLKWEELLCKFYLITQEPDIIGPNKWYYRSE